jgi:hypothetical protein
MEVDVDDFKARLIRERDDLAIKQNGLKTFLDGKLFETLDKETRVLLILQNNVMLTYLEILNRRIELLKIT